ncbi:hypothetical protein SADUNF_Sadunf16G0237600 [Salix dunnii]|uniref:BAH domain-containing protein n=1 Tax=Salix dunnii TaxID=1413687 RepID=A0A835JG04_9ROSI|nr:hypothetical protein SADUNF_Sadunf16G0237600 [Salix dunnii]
MTGSGHCFVEWKEQFISQERGNRVVHYFLKDSAGESIIAVVGTERSVRHMFYVVAEEFVQVYGAENSIHAGFKWRSRREVVDWLTSMLSKQHMQGDGSKTLQSVESVNGLGGQHMKGCLSKSPSGHDSDIVWSGIAWTCGKQLKHYPAFCRNATTITIQSFVFVMAKGQNHYLAYLEDMYEDKRGQKKVKVRWFHHSEEVKGVVPLRNAHPQEVFITPYSQVISAECVDGHAIVLTREHYEECFAAFPDALSTRIHLCFRQFRSKKVKPFDLSKLRGYFDQPILSCLNSKAFLGAGRISCGLNEEDEVLNPIENIKLGAKRTRSGSVPEALVTDHSGVGVSGSQIMAFDSSCLNLRYSLSGKTLLPLKCVDSHQWYGHLFKVDQKIELLCQDSGIRGCWFRCTVLQVSRKQIKIQYDDVQDEDEYGNLEEWVPAFKLAVADKLGMRHLGRPTMRPAPPPNEQTDPDLEVGSAVDAWWSDGWWEGVVTKIDNNGGDVLQLYDKLLWYQVKSYSWTSTKRMCEFPEIGWAISGLIFRQNLTILSAISATTSPETKTSISVMINKDLVSDLVAMSCVEVPTIAKPDTVEERKPEFALLSGSDSHLEAVACGECVMPPTPGSIHNEDGCEDIDISHGKGEVASDDEVQGNRQVEIAGDVNDCADKLDVEVLDTSEKNSKATELMEVMA